MLPGTALEAAAMRTRAILAIFCLVALGGGHRVGGNELLKLEISPRVAPAPGFVRVRTRVDASDDKRVLEVSADSPDFSRTSSVELEGRSAPRASVFSFENLPAGRYEFSAVLIGPQGVLATATRAAEIVPTPGARR
jgi:hypothetical protein